MGSFLAKIIISISSIIIVTVVDTLVIVVDIISNSNNSSTIIKMYHNLAMPVTKGLHLWSWEQLRFATTVASLATSKGIVLKNKTIKVEEVVGMDVAMWAEEAAEEMAEVK